MLKVKWIYFHVFVLSMIFLGCQTGPSDTSFEKWKRKEFGESGISILVPDEGALSSGHCLVRERSSQRDVEVFGYKRVTVFLHPVHLGFMLEPFWRMSVDVFVSGERNYKNGWFRNAFNIGINSEPETMGGSPRIYKEITTGYGPDSVDLHWTVIRKDIRLSADEYAVCSAAIFSGQNEYVAPPQKDIDAAIRMINSVRSIKAE